MMRIGVLIKPNSKHREGVVEAGDGSLVVYTKAPAEEGRANQAAAELLAEHFGVSKSQVELIRGHASKYKVFAVDTE